MASLLAPVGRAVDALVGVFSPHAGLRRVMQRKMLSRAYEGASRADGWRPARAGASANTDHAADAPELRARARALYQSVPYITSGIDSLVAKTVGTGFVPTFKGKNAEKLNQLMSQWIRQADADGIRTLYAIMADAYRAMKLDGEVLLRKRYRRAEDGLAVPLQLQLLEIDWLDGSKTGTNGSNTIVNGIEYDPLGRRVAYWLFDQHPGELQSYRPRGVASKPVAAAQIVHLFNPARPGQGRGFTVLSPVIAKVRDLQLYEDSEIARKNLETRLGVIASGDATLMANGAGDPTDPSQAAKETGSLGQLASGGILNVPAGMNLTTIEPKAAPGYVEYVKQKLHIIAAGFGVTYEMMTGDVREVNFSSARTAELNYRARAEFERWQILVPMMCDEIAREFVAAAELASLIPNRQFEVDWTAPKWNYVNPDQDVKADLAEISGGLSSFSEKLRQRGYKPELVFEELKTDIEKLRASGVLAVLLQLQTSQGDLAVTQPAQAQASAGRNAEMDAKLSEVRSLLERLSGKQDAQDAARIEGMRQELRALSQRDAPAPAAAPEVHVHAPITVHTPDVRSEIRVEPAAVSVTNQVQPTPVEIRAEAAAPVVHITNEITAQAGETQVVVAGPKTSTAEHERDARTGEILRTVTTHQS